MKLIIKSKILLKFIFEKKLNIILDFIITFNHNKNFKKI